MIEIYVHDDKDDIDFRQSHNSGVSVSPERITKLGIIAGHYRSICEVNNLASERNYKNRDCITLNVETFNNEEAQLLAKLNIFYEEHLHEDEEIRYCVEGSGYFDVKDPTNNEWIRCKLYPGDLLIIPAGIYHRFTLTTDNFIKAVRLFKEEPKWEAHNKSTVTDQLPIRKQYLKTIKP
ncbi:acireductone dioxygenase (Ni2+-requiring) NDAI_0H01480 [Naumovozyma dairenensis CBS 421]|uniref:Acireductone dioxygenase n=1 Tax=Naumovozyma dairenensis (strain ATCC 10597 / BCRC 20456 / CBS 421 / NBRC 0211 / NRRL Y-12639) TaxID=1071378 RepID=G0WEW1_NAUDC|nr:hypothetical protein NDAI_0H01480 [Naumovozyma dairenensis CBS 421]CCD26322.1 hypothetical protein NDAI_0H01480 [Naumovozyma dairenensis CBS 421]